MYKIDYTILSVDDNEHNLFTLEALLSKIKGVKVISATSGDEALKILLKNHIDLILSDIQMPVMDGFEFAKLIKSNKRTKDIPLIFVTAVFKSEEFIKRGFDLGAIDYITKPIDEYQLLNKLKLYINVSIERNKAIENEKKFYEITQTINEGIFSLDLDKKIAFINDSALSLLGYRKDELLGKKAHNYLRYKDKKGAVSEKECFVYEVFQTKKELAFESIYLVKKDGTFLNVSLYIKPLYFENEFSGVIVIFKDKTKENIILQLQEKEVINQKQIIYSMVELIESRDTYTAGHTRRVAKYCVLIAKEMGYSDEEIKLLEKSAWLHDIGKISTPDSILLKPARLNFDEYKLIQEHLTSGYEVLKKIDDYKELAEIMSQHHERYDGKGYPRGLMADEIKPLSRIMIVADAFDAMTTNRVYKSRKSVEEAINELKELSKIQFHPEVVEVAIKVLKDIEIEDSSQFPKTKLERERFAYYFKDQLTGAFTIDYLKLFLRYQFEEVDKFYGYIIKLHNFSAYNKKYGWQSGDLFLQKCADTIKKLDENISVFRIEGDDFLILSKTEIKNITDMLDRDIKNEIIDFEVIKKLITDKKEYLQKIIDAKNTQDFI